MPTISIIMSFYKPSTKSYFVFEKAVENILNQSFTDFEFLIFDDHGEDTRAIEFIKSIADPRMRFEQFKENSAHRPALRYNYGVEQAKGDYIFYAFEDDVVDRDALLHLHESLTTANADFSYGQTIIHTESGKLTFGRSGTLDQIMKFNFIPNNLILHKRSIVDEIGYQDSSKENNQDCDWKYWQKMMQHGYKGVFAPQALGEVFGPIFKTNLRKGK